MATLIASAAVPVLANGLAGSFSAPAALASALTSSANAWGGMAEGTAYQPPTGGNPYRLADTAHFGSLDYELSAILTSIRAGRNVVMHNDATADITARTNALAIIGLVFDQTHLYEGASFCGATSLIHVCPEAAVTFGSPLSPYPTAVSDLHDASTGTYRREFAACSIGGAAPFACAAVFNPAYTPGGAPAATLPSLSRAYTHRLTIAGTSLCGCYGDAPGSITTTTAAPTSIPQVTGYILTP